MISRLWSKWTLIYTAFGYDDYFKVVNQLKIADIQFKTKPRNNSPTIPVGVSGLNVRTGRNVQYDIYVYKEDEHKAQEAIHQI